MVGYINHNTSTIRLRSGGFDVALDAARFVRFDDMEAAKAFIDAGLNTDGHIVFDMATQAPFGPKT
jgi:hypothetical protein